MRLSIALFFTLLSLRVPAFPHHSFASEFDLHQPVVIKGTVSRVEWRNPHVQLFIDAKDSDGKVTSWQFEISSPNTLMRRGWTRNSLKVGDAVSVEGYRAKDGSAFANVKTVTVEGGSQVFTNVPQTTEEEEKNRNADKDGQK